MHSNVPGCCYILSPLRAGVPAQMKGLLVLLPCPHPSIRGGRWGGCFLCAAAAIMPSCSIQWGGRWRVFTCAGDVRPVLLIKQRENGEAQSALELILSTLLVIVGVHFFFLRKVTYKSLRNSCAPPSTCIPRPPQLESQPEQLRCGPQSSMHGVASPSTYVR